MHGSERINSRRASATPSGNRFPPVRLVRGPFFRMGLRVSWGGCRTRRFFFGFGTLTTGQLTVVTTRGAAPTAGKPQGFQLRSPHRVPAPPSRLLGRASYYAASREDFPCASHHCWNLSVAKGAKAVHPIGQPMSHSTHSGFGPPRPPLTIPASSASDRGSDDCWRFGALLIPAL